MFNTIKVNDTDTNYTHSIFDISEYNSGAIYANLSAALAAVPQNKKQGGMTVKFIQVQYSVVKTEGLETEPTGTLLSSAPSVDSGTYDESQLSGIFTTLPSSTGSGNALTYYVAVTVDETTTYTSWVITKVLNSDNKYVQYRLMSQTFSIIESNWQGVDEEPAFASHNLPESGGIFNAINEPEYMGTLPTWSTYSTSEGAGPAVTVDGNNVSIPISWVGDGRRVIIDIQNLTVGENYIFEFDWSKQGSSEECYLSNGIYRSTLNGKNLGNVIRKEIYGHVVLLVNRQSDIKYISFATNSMSYISAGDTMVVSNFTVYSNKMLFNRLSELEQGNSESIKNIRQQFTHFEKNTGRNNIDVVSSFGNDLGIDNNLSYFDRILTAEITDGNIVSGSRMVGYKQVSHGDIFSVIAHCNNATNTVTAIGLYFTTEKPAIGNTGLVTQYIKFIDGGIEDAIVEWVAPDNGYLVVRHVPRNTTTCILYKKEDFSRFINSYLEEIYALTLEAKKGINANADDAEHFGEVVSHSSSNYGVSEYIDIEGAKFIRMQVRYSTSDIFNSSLIGSVFYDSSKNPISVASMNNKAALQYWGSSIVSVPDTAKYIRVTEYLVDSPNISIYKTLESDFVKDIKELKNITGGLSANVFKESNFEPFAFINNRGVQITDGVIVSTEKNFNWTASYCYAKKGDVFKFEIEDSTGIVAAFYMFDEAPITVNKIGRLIKDVYYPTLANQLITVDVEIQEKGYFCMFMYRSLCITLNSYKYNADKETVSFNYFEDILTPQYVASDVIDIIPESANFGNAVTVSATNGNWGCCDYIDVADVKYIKIKQRKSRAKFTFSDDSAFGSLFYDINHEPIAYSGNAIEFMSNKDDYVINYNQGEILLKVPAAAKYFKYTGYTANGNRDSLVLLRETVKERLQDSENKTDYTSYINQARFVSGSPSIQSLGLLHFSDIHEDTVAALKVNEWATKYKDYINDVICTGDVVLRYLNGTDAKTWWIEKDIASKSLFVLGNHDQTYNSDVNVRRSYFYADGGEQGDGNIDFTIAKSEAIKPTHIFAFNQYFANFIDGLGVNMPIGYDDPSSPYYQACYWHKDYAAQKVRLIGVDCIFRFDGILAKDSNGNFIIDKNTGMLTIADDGQGYAKLTTEQETWLYNKLNETLDSNNAAYDYSVVVVCHYPLDDCDGWNVLGTNGNRPNWSNVSENGGIVLNHKTGDTVNFHYGSGNSAFILDEIFNMRNRVQSGSTAYGYNKGLVNNMGDIIQKWQSNGGKFVAWVCGHTHVDKFYYPKKYPNILCAVIDQAGSLRDHNQEYRNQDDYSNNIANYLSVDTQNGLFKIVRFGLNKDKLLTAKNYLCYDYINKFVVNEG